MIKLKVTFTKRIFANSDGFSIYGATPTPDYKNVIELSNYGNVTVSGDFTIDDKEMNNKVFTITIDEDLKARYPHSYKMVKIHYEFPDDAKEQWTFLLDSDLVTPMQYMNLHDKFKEDTKILTIIMEENDRIADAKGFGPKSAKKLQEKVRTDKYKALIYANFGAIDGIGPGLIKQIANWKPDVEDSIAAIKANPFELLGMKDIGFITVDAIRKGMGIPQDDKNRVLHGLKYFLTEKFQGTGNTYMNLNTELNEFADKLGVYKSTLVQHIKAEMNADGAGSLYGLKFFNQYATTTELFVAENIVYKKTRMLMEEKSNIKPLKSWKSTIDVIQQSNPLKLSDQQSEFLKLVNEEKILLLLGPGGSGKSWVTKIAHTALRKSGQKVGLYAPTARAAKVMTNYVDTQASTIARGLMKFADFQNDEGVLIDFGGDCPDDVLIIDEASMIDSELMATIYKAMRPEARIIIIGDMFQLPSVGPGNIFFDLIHSLKVPAVEFTNIYRQSEDSGIINVSTSLREGTFKIDEYANKIDMGEMMFFNERDDSVIKNMGLTLYSKLLKETTQEEIMFLSPTNKGASGRKNLNKEIQKMVNGDESKGQLTFGQVTEEEDFSTIYRKDDYITVTKNLYEVEDDYEEEGFLINGDIGTISAASAEKVTIEVNDQPFTFEKGDVIGMLEHMWSTTIHKAQGGQADYVVLVLPERSGFLSANMLYTAFTRAKKKCYVIGNLALLNRASKVYANFNRKTMINMQTRTANRDSKESA